MPIVNTDRGREARALAGIAVAVSVTMFAQLAISAVETVIVARLGVAALAGVTLALGLYSLVFLFTLGVVTAVTPLAARAHGAGDPATVAAIGQQGLWLGLGFAVPGALLLLAAGAGIGRVLGTGVEGRAAAAYLAGAAWGLPAWVGYVAIRCLAVATGRVRVTTAVMLTAVPAHAALAWTLTYGAAGLPALGTLGAGLATALTGCGALALSAGALAWSGEGGFGPTLRFDPARQRQLLRLGLPFACRIVLREGLFPAAGLAIAPFGAVAVAAHGVAARIVELTGVFSFGFSDAANMRVSQALGAGAPRRARQAAWIAIGLAAGVSAAVAVLVAAGRGPLARLVVGGADSAGLAAAVAVLPFAAGVQFLDGVQSAAGGALSGWHDARGPLVITLLGSWGVGMPLGILLANAGIAPAVGLWLGLAAGGFLTTGLYLLRLRRMQRGITPAAGRR